MSYNKGEEGPDGDLLTGEEAYMQRKNCHIGSP